MSFTRLYTAWKDWPNMTTPATAAWHQSVDDALVNAGNLKLINVQDPTYGAKGDGTTDDTTALQAAYTAARGQNAIVWHPAGTYRTTADLIVGSNTLLQGAGPGASLIVRDTTTATVAVVKNFDQVTYTDHDIHIRDLTVYRVGEASTPNATLDNAVQLIGVTRASVKDCRIRGGGKGVHMYGCVRWWVEDNVIDTFVDNGVAANPIGSNTVGFGWIARNEIASPTASGFSLGSSSIINGGQSFVHSLDNIIEDAGGNIIEYGGPAINGCRISGNVGRYSGKANVVNNILVHSDGISDLLIENNYINKGSINVTVDTTASASATNVHGRNNYSSQGGISYNYVKYGSSNGDVTYQSGLQANSCTDFDIYNPRVSYSTTTGISMASATGGRAPTRCRLFNAVSYGNGTAGTLGATYGISIDGGDTVEIVNCRAYDPAGGAGTQTHGLYINATTNYVDQANDFTGNKTAERASFTGSPTAKAVTTTFNGQFSGTVAPTTSTGSAVFGVDVSSGAGLVVANNGLGQPFGNSRNFSGIFAVSETAATGDNALFLANGGFNVVLIAQNNGGHFTVAAGSAGKINVYINASGAVEVQNLSGSSITLITLAFRTRAL